MRRHVYVTAGIDESKVRDEARKRLKDDRFEEPQETLIHRHAFKESCNLVWGQELDETHVLIAEEVKDGGGS